MPSGFRPQSVTFTSAAQGWVLGTAPCPSAVCTSLVRTQDGGRSWAGLPAPHEALTAPGQPGLTGLRFADPADGVAYGDSVWVTHDGGGSWARTPSPGGQGTVVASLQASGATLLAAVTAAPGASGAGPGAVSVYRSAVAHLAWTKVLTAPPAKQSGVAARLAVHGSTAWLIASGVLYRTSDGVHWGRGAFTCDPQHSFTGPVGVALGPDAAHVVVTCVGEAGAGSAEKEVAVSTDAGAHFTPTAAPPAVGDSADVAVPTAGSTVLATSSGASWLEATFDAGRTWTTVLTSLSGGQPWTDLGFTTPEQGVVVEGWAANPPTSGEPGSRLWMTHDGAHTWAPVTFAP